jgi:hypothetical protein
MTLCDLRKEVKSFEIQVDQKWWYFVTIEKLVELNVTMILVSFLLK